MACAVVVGTVLGRVLCVHPLLVDAPLLDALYTDTLMNVVLTIQTMSSNPPNAVLRLPSCNVHIAQNNSTVVLLVAEPRNAENSPDNTVKSHYLLDFVQRVCTKELTEHLRLEECENDTLRRGTIHDIMKEGDDARTTLRKHAPVGALGELMQRVARRVFTRKDPLVSLDAILSRIMSAVPGIVYCALCNPLKETVLSQKWEDPVAENLFAFPHGVMSDLVMIMCKGLHAAAKKTSNSHKDDKHSVAVLECTDRDGRVMRIGARLCRITSGVVALVFAFSRVTSPLVFSLPMTTVAHTSKDGPKAFGNYDVLVEVHKGADMLEKVFSEDGMAEVWRSEVSGGGGKSPAVIPHEHVDYE